MTAALKKSATHLTVAGEECLHKSISTLRSKGERLICIRNGSIYDSYDAPDYATLVPSTILKKMESMTTAGQGNIDFTLLQCQATSTAIRDVVV